ncbi:DUF3710 domain-containing protein [Actinotalea fermentans]|uniref:DUF3710 domain-containing protein n=1 Tax=Actinotalea fermentans TaxID=43671 RepID=A0A511YU68_9CELL|nr:DUF3710 domain-containing protein [Actinotalea fermentans]KGM17025.1 hypothetical protein N867_11565 [Actinotalea fermentans ATCC 43279 = JCM 9966 = DSM 3133]GEN78735.1 hypothetical protein AFE02nite_04690 [Actinotalea fermentans]
MGLFGRRSRDVDAPEVDELDGPGDGVVAGRERGPWDVDEVPEPGDRLDLGALWVPRREGMELRMEVDNASRVVTAATMALHGSTIQLQVFAAPRSAGIWDEIRSEIAESVTRQGGTVDDLPGPFGRELLARLPVRTAEGRTGHRPARFIGVDGPRWFLRGVISGRAAVDPEKARELEAVFADVVVVRGDRPRAPRDLLALTLPGQVRPAGPDQPGAAPATFDPLKRGPEITEVH